MEATIWEYYATCAGNRVGYQYVTHQIKRAACHCCTDAEIGISIVKHEGIAASKAVIAVKLNLRVAAAGRRITSCCGLQSTVWERYTIAICTSLYVAIENGQPCALLHALRADTNVAADDSAVGYLRLGWANIRTDHEVACDL